MKTALCIVLVLFSLSAWASVQNQLQAVTCNGELYGNAQFVNGNCFSNSCNATIPGESFSTQASCASGVTVEIQGYAPAAFVNAQCMNGSFFTSVPGASIALTGTCSDGTPFSGYVNDPGQELLGNLLEERTVFRHPPGGVTVLYGYVRSRNRLESSLTRTTEPVIGF